MPHIFIPPEFQNLERIPSAFEFPAQIWDFQPRFRISNPDFGFPAQILENPTDLARPGPTKKKGNAKPKKGTQKGTPPFFQNGDFARDILHLLKKGTQKGNAPIFGGTRDPGKIFGLWGHQISQSRGSDLGFDLSISDFCSEAGWLLTCPSHSACA